MTEAQPSLSSFKEQFDNQLTCSVCLYQLTNPKVLPCHHSFCLECIQPLPSIIKVIYSSSTIVVSLFYTLCRMVNIISVVHHVVFNI